MLSQPSLVPKSSIRVLPSGGSQSSGCSRSRPGPTIVPQTQGTMSPQ